MDSHHIQEHLQTIRTLMERSALYRRALAPILTFVGSLGLLAALAGWRLQCSTPTSFIAYWLAVAILAIAGALLLVRRQALNRAEPFWSPPTRRVAQAMFPALLVGLLLGLLTWIASPQPNPAAPLAGTGEHAGHLVWLTAAWAILYGLAIHAAGFFVSRGLRWLGWLYLAAGSLILLSLLLWHPATPPQWEWPVSHWLMGGLFGGGQLASGLYLYFTGEARVQP